MHTDILFYLYYKKNVKFIIPFKINSRKGMMRHDPKNLNKWIFCEVDEEIDLKDGAELRFRAINNQFPTCK